MNREVLHIGVSDNGGTRVVRLTGELDSYTSYRLTSVADTWIPGAQRLLVNLDGLDYIDSSGLSALVGMWVKATETGADMSISCRNPRIHRVLEITGLVNLFNIQTSSREARVLTGAAYNAPVTARTGEYAAERRSSARSRPD
jgi:anti-sigma B factor antagonist